MLFTPADRDDLRASLLDAARADSRITGAAITGSAALGTEDRWSDVDLAFGVAGDLAPVLTDFTARMYAEHGAIHHVDVTVGAWIYRVFMLASTLQVDLAFTPELHARAPSFQLVFGAAAASAFAQPPAIEQLIGEAWLHALHVRSALARGRLWQAEYMIAGTRDRVLELACVRHGVPSAHGKGVDQLPGAVLDPLRASLVGSLTHDDLARAFAAVLAALQREIVAVDPALANRLRATLDQLTVALTA